MVVLGSVREIGREIGRGASLLMASVHLTKADYTCQVEGVAVAITTISMPPRWLGRLRRRCR